MLPARGTGMVWGSRWDLGQGWGAGTPVGGWEHFLGSLVAQNPKIFLWSHPRSISFRMNPKPLRFSCGHFLAGVRIDHTQNGYTGVTGCSGHPRVDCTLHGTSGFQIVDQHRV